MPSLQPAPSVSPLCDATFRLLQPWQQWFSTTVQSLNTGLTSASLTITSGGIANLSGALNVGGATGLSGSLNVTGGATFSSTLNANGAATLQSTLNVTGAATLQSSLNVNGATALAGLTANGTNLATLIAGNTNLNGSVAIANPQNISFGANWLNWTPTYAGSGSMSVALNSLLDAQYLRIGPLCFFKLLFVLNLSGGPSNFVTVSLPVSVVGPTSTVTVSIGPGGLNYAPAYGQVASGASTLYIYNSGFSNFAVVPGSYAFIVEGFYRAA